MCSCGRSGSHNSPSVNSDSSRSGDGSPRVSRQPLTVALSIAAGLAFTLGLVAGVRGDTPSAQPTAPDKPALQPPASSGTQTPKPAAPASLDDLLGLKPVAPGTKDAQPAIAPARVDQGAKLLEGPAEGEKVDDEFSQAVALMHQSAKRLGRSADASLETQRLQQDTINKLEQLIKKSQKKQKSSSSCSNGSCDQNQSQNSKGEQQGSKGSQQQPQQSQASQQGQGQREQSQQRTQRDGTGDREQITAGSLDTKLGQQPGGLDATRAAWGNLPARLRQSLLQGSGDAFSSEYQRLTEAYYKRLGEQGSK